MISVSIENSIPQNSWLIDVGNKCAFIGSGVVRVGQNSWFEGSWSWADNPFSDKDECLRFGSGFKVENDLITIISPSHSLESVYLINQAGNLFISNSLAFVMSRVKELVFTNSFKMKDLARPLWRSTEGIINYPREIYANKDLTIFRYFFCRLDIGSDFSVLEKSYKTPFSFNDFASYRQFLIDTIVQAANNSNAVEIASYISRGYDSVACASLAKIAGGNLTFSIKTSRDGLNDNGSVIANKLGMKSIEFDRPTRSLVQKKFDWGVTNFEILTDEDKRNFEFFTGLNFEDEILYIDYDLQNHIILTGFNGDVLWSLNSQITSNLERKETSGSSIYEFRLRKGFIHIPIPSLLNQISANIRAISISKEMKDYIVPKSTYNRPIPRRIAEEMGVPRDDFGMQKTAASTMVDNLDDFRDIFFQELMKRYELLLT